MANVAAASTEVICRVTASPMAKFAALTNAGKVNANKPPLAETPLLVAMVVAPFFSVAVMPGLTGIEPLASV